MISTLIQAVSSGANSQSLYPQSVIAIEQYTKWIVAQQDTGDATLDTILNTEKRNATTWYNSIYPTYLMMPENILGQGTQIDSDLSILISLSQQLETNDTAPIRASIVKYAENLIKTLSGLENDINTLSVELGTFLKNLISGNTNFQKGENYITNMIQVINQQYMRVAAELNSEKRAACPSQTAINSAEKQLIAIKERMVKYSNIRQVFSVASNKSHLASQASGFIENFWLGINADIHNCTLGLTKIKTEPASVLKVDLLSNQKNWNAIKSQFEAINKSVNPSFTK